EQRRRHEIRELEPNVVEALPEHRSLNQPIEWIASHLMLLGEYRVSHFGILVLHSAVAQHDPDLICLNQQMLEAPGQVLDGVRVAAPRIQGRAGRLHPYPTDQSTPVAVEQSQ